MIPLSQLNAFRQPALEIALYGQVGNDREGMFAFLSPHAKARTVLRVVASSDFGWDHVSVSTNKPRCPTWEEMSHVRHKFFHPYETVMELHVPVQLHVNLHEYTLHLWRPQEGEIPLPPHWMVGPRNVEELKEALDGDV
jgi:hypothetical protein